ncbi:MAG TPA: 5'-methylthioadenosine nucleosidase/S-adenosylhomocysteine nucleosidase, partial [Burkholderiales bacterium]|nr:5'-methylthioadenosine nucleosidase/S-adenosylhomocysteine nucleosidase [Burkholderiales bacterium]
FVAVRVVVDTADMTFPRSAIRASDEYGRLHITKLLFSLLAHPADLSALIGLSKSFRAAQATLQTIARLAGPKLCLQ